MVANSLLTIFKVPSGDMNSSAHVLLCAPNVAEPEVSHAERRM